MTKPVGQRARRLDPPLLTEGPLSGSVFVVTVGKVLENGIVESTTKYDVTDQFEALAQSRGWSPPGQKITHGRHCTCGACARQDWTDADLAPCGMHGRDCPPRYQPWGRAGSYVNPEEVQT